LSSRRILFLKTEAGDLVETARTCQTARVISLETENVRFVEEFSAEIYLSRLMFDMLLSASADACF